MKTTQWDRVVSSAPQNAQAAIVRDGSGDLYQPRLFNALEGMPPLKPITPQIRLNPAWVDYTGRRIGRATVVGLMQKKTGSKTPASWVCKCVCGYYLTATSKTIRRAMNGEHDLMCGWCADAKKIREGVKNKGRTTLQVVDRRAARRAEKEGR